MTVFVKQNISLGVTCFVYGRVLDTKHTHLNLDTKHSPSTLRRLEHYKPNGRCVRSGLNSQVYGESEVLQQVFM